MSDSQLLTFRTGQEETRVAPDFVAWEFRSCRSDETWMIHPHLLVIAQAVRDVVGTPVRVTSGYRSADCQQTINPAVPNSNHIRGKAMDLVVDGLTGWEIAGLVHAIGNATGLVTGLGISQGGSAPYPSVHVSVDGREGIYAYRVRSSCPPDHPACTMRVTPSLMLRLDNEAARWESRVQAWMQGGGSEGTAMESFPNSPTTTSSTPARTPQTPEPPSPVTGILPAIGIVAGTLGLLVILA